MPMKSSAAKPVASQKSWMIGFKSVNDVALFPDKYFVIYGR